MHKILLVDDEPSMLSAMSRVLTKAGFDVLEASDGEQAMELLRDNHVDLTVIDIFMPNVDGMEFTIRVRARVPDAKIIAISGGGTIERGDVLEIARSFGVTRTLGKPFGMADLLAVVNEVLGLPPVKPGSGGSGKASGEC